MSDRHTLTDVFENAIQTLASHPPEPITAANVGVAIDAAVEREALRQAAQVRATCGARRAQLRTAIEEWIVTGGPVRVPWD